MQRPLLAGEPMALLAYMAAERGIHDKFAVATTRSEREKSSPVRSASWRSGVARKLRGIANRIEPATVQAGGSPGT
jgi:hypothetical protein